MGVLEREVRVNTPLGIHARAALLICELASNFSCDISIAKLGSENNSFINAKSVLSVMSLGAPCGSRLLIRTEGEDAQEALNSLSKLLEDVNLGTPPNNSRK
jgi:phosphotransferase system HPr (HPr) family protein